MPEAAFPYFETQDQRLIRAAERASRRPDGSSEPELFGRVLHHIVGCECCLEQLKKGRKNGR